MEPQIGELEGLVASLPPQERERFHRLFQVSTTEGRLWPPSAMAEWLRAHFGSITVVERQKIVRVTNLVTLEGSIFNPLRSRRPQPPGTQRSSWALSQRSEEDDPLCHPLSGTPEEEWGRIKGKHCLTAGNVAKAEGFHCLIVFKEHDPLSLGREQIIDYVETGWRWAWRAHQQDPEAKYFLFFWNCLERAGATLGHGHAQALLGRGLHYAKVEALRGAAVAYGERYGANYFDDLYECHRALGCGWEWGGVKVLALLTPVKEREVMVLGEALNAPFLECLWEVVHAYRERLGVLAFNLMLTTPPLAPAQEDWSGFPVLARLVDRGDPRSSTSDVGAMELYAASVIASDPFEVASAFRGAGG